MGKRAIAYKERLEKGGGTLWTRRCWKEVKRRERRREE